MQTHRLAMETELRMETEPCVAAVWTTPARSSARITFGDEDVREVKAREQRKQETVAAARGRKHSEQEAECPPPRRQSGRLGFGKTERGEPDGSGASAGSSRRRRIPVNPGHREEGARCTRSNGTIRKIQINKPLKCFWQNVCINHVIVCTFSVNYWPFLTLRQGF